MSSDARRGVQNLLLVTEEPLKVSEGVEGHDLTCFEKDKLCSGIEN